MAAAAAEETADVNARAFIGRRRLGRSRDGARVAAVRPGRGRARPRTRAEPASGDLTLAAPRRLLRRWRGVASSVAGPCATVAALGC